MLQTLGPYYIIGPIPHTSSPPCTTNPSPLLFLIIYSINDSMNNFDIPNTCPSYIIFPRILYIIQITGLAWIHDV
jgi:hypothetical protein